LDREVAGELAASLLVLLPMQGLDQTPLSMDWAARLQYRFDQRPLEPICR
jgi:hypothetical protein